MSGKVYLVGSGPGGEGLLTQRAREVINAAEVVLFDQLPGEEILSSLPVDAEKIDCGKKGGSTMFAIIERVLRKDRRVTTGSLATIADAAQKKGVRPPAVIVIGDVVKLYNPHNPDLVPVEG